MNPDIEKERKGATIDLDKMKLFLGEILYGSEADYHKMNFYRNKLAKQIKPISEENFYNLDRKEKYEIIMKKALEFYEFVKENKLNEDDSKHHIKSAFNGAVFGLEKLTFGLHESAFVASIDLWSNEEQRNYWLDFINKHTIFGTYVQTEIGHGTFVRGLETTATYDKASQEFILNCPTLTSIKFWPGAAAKSCNYAIVMAKLIIDNKDHGIQAFVVQLRSLEDHTLLKGVETGDIGPKFGFEAMDNGYVKFTNVRIPRFNMLMRIATVSPDGKFERTGSELIMYACMLMLRGALSLFSSSFLTLSTTIAIRYSSVRRQTANDKGEESQVIDYQTQQYRLFPSLATAYVQFFASNNFMRILAQIRKETNMFNDIKPPVLAKLHAVSAGLKATTFSNCLKFSQSNRLCCGGHGYSSSSGLSQIVQEADAGCTYEGDNIVLLLQTARYLLKCTQKNVSPHLDMPNIERLRSTDVYKYFEPYLNVLNGLYEQLILEVSNKMMMLITEQGLNELKAWNECSVMLITAAKSYILLFMVMCSLSFISENQIAVNQQALKDLFEVFLLYEICENNVANLLRLDVIRSDKLKEYDERLLKLLPKIRVNAVALVDSFDYLDSNLGSSLGAYDGNVYERLLDFARNSKMNQQDVHEVYHKYLKPFIQKQKRLDSKL